jgi:glycosyltransferase involved in cell wall biosynthesis
MLTKDKKRDFSDYSQVNIAVIICTKNGSEYIDEQLESIVSQVHTNMDIYISDNNSDDYTVEKINQFIKNNHSLNVTYLNGNDYHFANNFIDIAKRIKKRHDYYAFCDQDDVWDSTHTIRSIKYMEQSNKNLPLLYCSRTKLINENGNKIGLSKSFKKKPSFKNALVQSIAGGNTMVYNNQAYNLLKKIDINKFIPSHDWILYILVSGYNGVVFYNKKPSVKYRQHSKNAIGSNLGLIQSLKRILLLFQGVWRQWLDANSNILKSCDDLPEETMKLLKEFDEIRKNNNVFFRIMNFKKLGIYRQTFFGNVSIYIALIIKKI